jgi:DNA-binding IclR family transcriptional regulator
MSSVIKALHLLNHFSTTQPEIGLSQLCRLAKRDKATTYRQLQALEVTGFVEKNSLTKRYRLGPALLQLAQVREATVPRKEGAESAIFALADATGETSHVSVLSGTTVYGLASCESPKHSTRAIIDLDTFPLHATASGLCALAFGPAYLMDAALSDLTLFTQTTVANSGALEKTVQATRKTGFGRANRCFESDIESLSAPLFDQTGQFAGAVSVACVATRFTPVLEKTIKNQLINASRDITHNWGGFIPSSIKDLWAKSLIPANTLEAI